MVDLSKITGHDLPVEKGYAVKVVSLDEKDRALGKILKKQKLFTAKARIHYTSVQLVTNVPEFQRMWLENFYSADESMFSHSILFAINDGGKFSVCYEPKSRCLIVMNCDYYGWVKSMALALVADVVEDYAPANRRYSVHGSAVDYNGRGLAMMAPSGSGKTTLTYGLMLSKAAHYISDDWLFVRPYTHDVIAFSSEKNSYIREDLPRVWKEYGVLQEMVKLDNRKRGIADLSNVLGAGNIRRITNLTTLVLLKRDAKDKRKFWEMEPGEAFDYIKKNDYCNPQHQLIRDERKISMRDEFFRNFTSKVKCYMLNTTETPHASLGRLEEVVKKEFGA